jgi:hypothetical protein
MALAAAFKSAAGPAGDSGPFDEPSEEQAESAKAKIRPIAARR